jgi:hypothetical protein
LIEERGVGERLENAAPNTVREIELTLRAVLESETKTVVAERLDIGHMH